MSKEEISRMTKDAEAHATRKIKPGALVDIKNKADGLIFQVEKELQEHGGKVGPQERGDIESATNRLKELVKGEDKASLERAG